MFPWTPIVQTSAANWLTRFKWKEILSTLGRECIMKNFRAVLEKSNIEISLLMHVLGYILPWTTIFCFGYFIMFKQLFVLHFHKYTFNFVPPMFYVGIWRSHHFMRGATVFWGGHRWPGGPPVASDEKRHPYIYIYIYMYIYAMGAYTTCQSEYHVGCWSNSTDHSATQPAAPSPLQIPYSQLALQFVNIHLSPVAMRHRISL